MQSTSLVQGNILLKMALTVLRFTCSIISYLLSYVGKGLRSEISYLQHMLSKLVYLFVPFWVLHETGDA